MKEKIKHFNYFLLVSIILIILVGFSYGMVEYSRRSSFCRDCHEMGSAHDTWMASKHGPLLGDIDSCYVCHAEEGLIGYIKSKLEGVTSLYFHLTGNFDDIGGRQKPVYCIKSGCHTMEDIEKDLTINVNHVFHLENGNKCVDCHDRIAHGWDPSIRNSPDMKKFCFKCHNNIIAPKDNCGMCHIYQENMLKGITAQGIENHPSIHGDELTCKNCHAMACNPSLNSCQECHGEEIIESLKKRQFEVSVSLEQLNNSLRQLKRIFESPRYQGDEYKKERECYEMAQYNYNFILKDKSRGFHNFIYCTTILDAAIASMDAIMIGFIKDVQGFHDNSALENQNP
ncbi:MAG: NapC/NirT family cytochrome c [bacterium]